MSIENGLGFSDFLDTLMDGAEVEWKALGEVAEYSKTRIEFHLVDKENYVGVDNLLQNQAGKTVSNYVPANGSLIEYLHGDILIGNIRPYLKKIWHANQDGGTNGDVLVIRPTHPSINSRYLYKVLTEEKFFTYNMQHAKGAKMPRGDKEKILEYQIPIPCQDNPKKSLAIQAEIVRILDKFHTIATSLTEGLRREIELRKKQYDYYLERMLSFDGIMVDFYEIEEIGEIYGPLSGKSRWDFGSGYSFCLNHTHINENLSIDLTNLERVNISDNERQNKVQYGDVVFNSSGTEVSKIGLSCVIDKELSYPVYLKSFSFGVRFKEWVPILPKYSKHVFRSKKIRDQITKTALGSDIFNISKSKFLKVRVPIPPIEIQEEVANVLDKFDGIVNSKSFGLRRELELRKKQYNYYRNLLLSFKKSA